MTPSSVLLWTRTLHRHSCRLGIDVELDLARLSSESPLEGYASHPTMP
jgi:hypothetical protein